MRVLKKLKEYEFEFAEVIVVDNISPDGTAQIAAEFMAKNHMKKMRVVQNPANIGLGGSHKLIFDYAIEHGFDHVTILHGDDQGDLADMGPVLALMKETPLTSFWMGARFHPSSQLKGYSAFRILGNRVFNLLAGVITTREIYDLGGSGVNVFPVPLLKAHPYRLYANDLTFHVYLLLNAFRLNQEVQFRPVSWREDDQISNVKLISQSWKLLQILTGFFRSASIWTESGMQFQYRHKDWIDRPTHKAKADHQS
jgi:glycosyltransferase involved in cell wall biosynthesis